MPICNKPALPIGSRKGNTEIDDHASEAAKLKRAREQAYFNSYNFDAIEVLPYENEHKNQSHCDDDADDDDDDDVHVDDETLKAVKNNRNKTLAKYQRSKERTASAATATTTATAIAGTIPGTTIITTTSVPALTTAAAAATTATLKTIEINHENSVVDSNCGSLRGNGSTSRCGSGSGSGSSNLSSSGSGRSNSEKILSMKYAYLQRLGSFFVSTQQSKVSEAVQSTKEANANSNANANVVDGNFLLPRAMLKYQSNNSNSSNGSSIGSSNSSAVDVSTSISMPPLTVHSSVADSKTTPDHNKMSEMMMMTTKTISMVSALLPSNNNELQQQTTTQHLPVNTVTQSRSNFSHEDSSFKTSFLASKENLMIAPKTLTRNKKQSTDSTTTTTTTSIESLKLSSGAASTAIVVTIDSGSGRSTNQLVETKKQLNAPRSTIAAALENAAEPHGRANSHQSQYSTEKSGSSGYYSSNVCSTYSIEDHIYCEPVVDILDLNSNNGKKSKSGKTNIEIAGKYKQQQQQQQRTTLSGASVHHQTGKPISTTKLFDSQTRTMNGFGSRNNADETDGDGDNDDDESDGKAVVLRGGTKRRLTADHFNEKLRVLETSIDNLDRHLKNFPILSPQERIVSFMHTTQPYLQQQQHQHQHQQQHHELVEKHRLPYNNILPTILEGYVPANQPKGPSWQDDDIPDDSLLDIDLDSFLLRNEAKDKEKRKVGIDNPNFIPDELEENNYKCAKYINSCPENAYRVESDIIGTESHGTISQKSLSPEHYLRRYEDQLHFQSTRELLEDVRDKIRVLSQSQSDKRSSGLSESSSSQCNSHEKPTITTTTIMKTSTAIRETEVPKELESMIKTLKSELESYLDRMNQHSEYEIRQLCSGLVKNENIVKMKNAFERRRSITEQEYEALECGGGLSGVPKNIRQQIASIRCASDPNFKMKRKSLAEVFPTVNCYIESTSTSSRLPHQLLQTQLQRNLSYHKPVLNQLDAITREDELKNLEIAESSARKVCAPGGDNVANDRKSTGSGESGGDKDSILDWHRKKPSIWEMYYGTNRMHQSLLGKRNGMVVNTNSQSSMSYPSSRPESDFTLDLPRAEQLRIKMEKEKKFRQRCRYITTFLSLVFFLLTVMVVSLVLTRGKRMFGSMI